MSNYSDAVLANTPLGYWRLGESGGSTFADSSGNGHTLTFSAGVTTGADGPLRDGNAAATFDGTANAKAVTSSGVNTWFGDTTLSFEAWVYNAAWEAATHEMVISLGAAHYLSVNLAKPIMALTLSSGLKTNQATAAISAGAWHHLVTTWASGEPLRLYVDGAEVVGGTPAAATGTITSSANIFVGCLGGASLFTSGLIDEVALYRSQLTAAQVLTHFRAGTPATPLSAFPWALIGTMEG